MVWNDAASCCLTIKTAIYFDYLEGRRNNLTSLNFHLHYYFLYLLVVTLLAESLSISKTRMMQSASIKLHFAWSIDNNLKWVYYYSQLKAKKSFRGKGRLGRKKQTERWREEEVFSSPIQQSICFRFTSLFFPSETFLNLYLTIVQMQYSVLKNPTRQTEESTQNKNQPYM